MTTTRAPWDPQELATQAAWLRRLACGLLRDHAAAEDVAQQVWVEAIRKPPPTAADTGVSTPWLSTVARNLARKAVRTQRRRARREGSAAQLLEVEPSPSAEALLARHEAQRLLAELVSQLAEPYRSTVLLRYVDDVSPAEIARRLGIPPGTVRWRLKHALDTLRAQVQGRQAGEGGHRWARALVPLVAGPPRDLPGWKGGLLVKASTRTAAIAVGCSRAGC